MSLLQIEASPELIDGSQPLTQQPEPAAGSALIFVLLYVFTRLAFGSFLLLTSVYCLLVSVSFSYFGFIHNPLLNSIPAFTRLHGPVYGILVAAIAFTLVPGLRHPHSRRATVGFLVVNGCVAIYLWWGNALGRAGLNFESYLWSMLTFFPLVWLGALDLSGTLRCGLTVTRNRLNLAKTTAAAVLIAVAFSAASALHNRPLAFVFRGLEASLCFHLVIFTAVGIVVILINRFFGRPPLSLLLKGVFAWVLLTQTLRTLILPTISFEGTPATVFAVVVAFALVFFVLACAIKLWTMLPPSAGTQKVLGPWLWAVVPFALIAAAYLIPALLGRTDWDFAVQKMAVLLTWLIVLQAICRTHLRANGRTRTAVLLVLLISGLLAFARYGKLVLYNPSPSPQWEGVLDEFAGADIGFRTAYDILSRPVDNQAYRQLYQFLKQNTNLDRNTVVPPADVRLVSDLKPAPGIKPNIFIFVIDSLRRDYLSPYNPQVDFTPEIDRFARDSVVLENAYTRYGGTALSEPAIWVGAMQLHKQYIEPFFPMNNLQKLLETDGYHSYISIDPILRVILHSSPSITELDHNSQWSDLDFIPTLKELEAKIDSRSDRNQPIFAYTQPQNVHTITLARSKIKGGRRAVSISELRRMDAAFGEFIRFLEQRGLYQNSIIILTADHGDSYGEFGRWGHSNFLFPEIIRIPLVVHIPPRVRAHLAWDARQVAFTTDITPSLYYLLGHRPIINDEIFGRPLFTETPQEQTPYLRSHYLIVSSYAPVYAILSGNGHFLFIVDAVHSKSYYYDLEADPAGSKNHVTIQIENEDQRLLRQDVAAIDNFYHWHPAAN